MASVNVQAQIRHNAEAVQEYFKDLQKWRSAVKEKEAPGERAEGSDGWSSSSLTAAAASTGKSPSYSSRSEERQREDGSGSRRPALTSDANVYTACQHRSALARDSNSIASYYAAWDRFNVDEELAKIDSKDSTARTADRRHDEKTAPRRETPNSASATRRQGRGPMRAVVKCRQTNEADHPKERAANASSSNAPHTGTTAEHVNEILQMLRAKLLDALATNQTGLLNYSCSRCRSAIKDFEACVSSLEEQSSSKSLSDAANLQPCSSLLSHWKKLRSIFRTNLGFSHLCLARSRRGFECAASAGEDWPESPFVRLLQAACHRKEGNYAQAAQHLRELLAQLGSIESDTPGEPSAAEPAATRNSSEDVLAASIVAFSKSDFNFLSSTVAITSVMAGPTKAACVGAGGQIGSHEDQLPQSGPRAHLSQKQPIAEAPRRTEATEPRQSRDTTGTGGSVAAGYPAQTEACTLKNTLGLSGSVNVEHWKEYEGESGVLLRSGPPRDVRSAVSAELVETLALRQQEVLALRRQRQQRLWQSDRKRAEGCEAQADACFSETAPVITKISDSTGGCALERTSGHSTHMPRKSVPADRQGAAVEVAGQAGTTGSGLRTNPFRQLHVQVLGESRWFREGNAEKRTFPSGLLDTYQGESGCAAKSNGLAHGAECLAVSDMHAQEQYQKGRERSNRSTVHAQDTAPCENSMSFSQRAQGQSQQCTAGVQASYVPRVVSASVSDSLECGVTPPTRLNEASNLPQAGSATLPAPEAPGTQTAGVPRPLPPNTYLSFRQRWCVMCVHVAEKRCGAELGTAVGAPSQRGPLMAQQQESTQSAGNSLSQCASCLRDRLTLLGSIAEHRLFRRVFAFSLEPDILADILQVIADGLECVGESNSEKKAAVCCSGQSVSRSNMSTAGKAVNRGELPRPAADSEKIAPLSSMIRPRCTGPLSLTCAQDVLVQLSEVPRFWSAVHQFDEHELSILRLVLRCCLQEADTAVHDSQDARPSLPLELSASQHRTVAAERQEILQRHRSLARCLHDIQAKLSEASL